MTLKSQRGSGGSATGQTKGRGRTPRTVRPRFYSVSVTGRHHPLELMSGSLRSFQHRRKPQKTLLSHSCLPDPLVLGDRFTPLFATRHRETARVHTPPPQVRACCAGRNDAVPQGEQTAGPPDLLTTTQTLTEESCLFLLWTHQCSFQNDRSHALRKNGHLGPALASGTLGGGQPRELPGVTRPHAAARAQDTLSNPGAEGHPHLTSSQGHSQTGEPRAPEVVQVCPAGAPGHTVPSWMDTGSWGKSAT